MFDFVNNFFESNLISFKRPTTFNDTPSQRTVSLLSIISKTLKKLMAIAFRKISPSHF